MTTEAEAQAELDRAKDAHHAAWRSREAAERKFRANKSADALANLHIAQKVEDEAAEAVEIALTNWMAVEIPCDDY